MSRAIAVSPAWLRRHPLPAPDAGGDKDDRGRVLVIGGATQVPGAILLAGVAALRAGAGKLQLATVRRAAMALGVAVPEALVIGLDATRAGEIAGKRAVALLRERISEANAVLVGPGMSSERSAHALIGGLVSWLRSDATLVLDAAAVVALRDDDTLLHGLHGRVLLTPHAGEAASLLGVDKADVETSVPEAARLAAARFGAVVALKGAETFIAEPDGRLCRYAGGGVGLATSGSGDTLAGIAAGLAARGAGPLLAATWAVHLHGAAGRALARARGRIGFLARELLDEIPIVLERGSFRA